MSKNTLDCGNAIKITNLKEFAKLANIELSTAAGKRKTNRVLCDEINQLSSLPFESLANSAPFYDETKKKSVVTATVSYIDAPQLIPTIDILPIEYISSEPFDYNGTQVVNVHWSNYENSPTMESWEQIQKYETANGKIDRKITIIPKQMPKMQLDEPVITEKPDSVSQSKPTVEENPAEQSTSKTAAKKRKTFDEPEEQKQKRPSMLTSIVEEPLIQLSSVSTSQEIPSVSQLDTLSNYFRNDLKKYYKFRGTYVYEWGWLMYLQQLLPKDVVCVWKNQDNKSGFFYDAPKYSLEISNWAVTAIRNCATSGSRFIVNMLIIKFDKTKLHANALIFDTKYKKLIRFEPHGGNSNSYSQKQLDSAFVAWLTQQQPLLEPGWTYVAPASFCPALGPQSKESLAILEESLATRKVFGKDVKKEAQGFCTAWSLLFIHLRIKNPLKTEEEIVKSLTDLTSHELAQKIRGYAEFIVETIETQPKESLKVGDIVKILNVRQCVCAGKIAQVLRTNVRVYTNSQNPRFRKVALPATSVALVTDPKEIEKIERELSAFVYDDE